MIVESKSWTYQLKDSAADSKLKLLKAGETFGVEKPGGEKRLHIGSINNEDVFDDYFFPNGDEEVLFEVSKIDLIQYLLSAKDEYTNPIQSYRLPINEYYSDLLEYIWSIEEESFTIPFVKNVDSVRYYLSRPSGNPASRKYLFVNKICLPIVTVFNLIRNKNDDNTYDFYLKPVFVNPTSEDSKQEYIASHDTLPLQQIFYGAPGTGKSNKVKELTGDGTFGKNFTFRTTFHPDSDYASFMGAYKPKWDEGTGKIVYDFRPQTFLKAYIKAWTNPNENVALVIEEINRGNCAQIFGDIFQLLDRENNGLSKYPIGADIDMQSYLCKELASMSEEDKDAINEYYSQHYEEAFNKIKNGEILTLPKNLSLLATMNTSDQSLFPMDSAFKRRWEWIYKPIVNGEKNWKIEVSDDYELIDWWDFLTLINGEISDLTTSEDKQLGYFFCQPDKDITTISAKNFVGKVIFYLWNDIFKDYGYEPKCCKDDNGKELLYAMFYDGEGEKVNTETLATFFTNLSKSNEKIQLLKKKATPSAETTETLETSESTEPRTEE